MSLQGHDKLKMHIKNPKATTKTIQQKVKANTPIEKTKQNHNQNILSKGGQKRRGWGEGTKNE